MNSRRRTPVLATSISPWATSPSTRPPPRAKIPAERPPEWPESGLHGGRGAPLPPRGTLPGNKRAKPISNGNKANAANPWYHCVGLLLFVMGSAMSRTLNHNVGGSIPSRPSERSLGFASNRRSLFPKTPTFYHGFGTIDHDNLAVDLPEPTAARLLTSRGVVT
jgi:hypothetical protein